MGRAELLGRVLKALGQRMRLEMRGVLFVERGLDFAVLLGLSALALLTAPMPDAARSGMRVVAALFAGVSLVVACLSMWPDRVARLGSTPERTGRHSEACRLLEQWLSVGFRPDGTAFLSGFRAVSPRAPTAKWQHLLFSGVALIHSVYIHSPRIR